MGAAAVRDGAALTAWSVSPSDALLTVREVVQVTTSETAFCAVVLEPAQGAVPGVVGTAVGSGKGIEKGRADRVGNPLRWERSRAMAESQVRTLVTSAGERSGVRPLASAPAIPDKCSKCGGGRLDQDREDEDTYVCAVCSMRHYRGRTAEVLAALAADLENPHIFHTTKWWGEPDEPRQLELLPVARGQYKHTPRHGTRNEYDVHGCRCEPCCSANRMKNVRKAS